MKSEASKSESKNKSEDQSNQPTDVRIVEINTSTLTKEQEDQAKELKGKLDKLTGKTGLTPKFGDGRDFPVKKK
ncbi:hypothetical protein JYU03_00165 [bacterium AH-315-F03]|nr:hypothetical protein [bacterium AH-315-F03]